MQNASEDAICPRRAGHLWSAVAWLRSPATFFALRRSLPPPYTPAPNRFGLRPHCAVAAEAQLLAKAPGVKVRTTIRFAVLGTSLLAPAAWSQDYGSTLGGKPDPYRAANPALYPVAGASAPATPGVTQPWNPNNAPVPGQPAAQPQAAPPPNGSPFPPPGMQTQYPQVQYPQTQPQPQFPPPNAQVAFEPVAAPQEKLAEFEPGKIVAVVGDQYILAGDVRPTVQQVLEPFYAKAKSALEREGIEAQENMLAQQITRQLIDTKLMYLEFERTVPKDKVNEVAKKVRQSFDKEFTEAREKLAAAKDKAAVEELVRKDPLLMRMAVSMKENQIETLAELDTLLKKYNTSLERQTKAYGENRLGRSMVSKHINFSPEITFDEMLAYYQENAADFDVPARAKWEALMVRKDGFPDKNAAYNAIAGMGNEVFFGAPLEAVAKRSSQGLNAAEGGKHDWTQQGSLALEMVDQAIFTLPTGKLSQILEDGKSYYILRVTERQEASRIPFDEAQEKIREKIKSQKVEKQYKAYVEKLRHKTPVWCIYDKNGALNPNEQQAERQPGERLPQRR